MATFFQSFRSSNMPKRLLRYALSRLELLEEETLDMDNLDFALGRNTTFEFKDVGVRLKKLEHLLQLPPSFKLQKARVLKLTVTIPMDFYTSPIIVEVDGVDIRLRVTSVEDSRSKGKSTGKTGDDPSIVPHTMDLAASFLETQPLSEKKKLEDALAAESHDMGASVALSDSSTSEDDEPALGTGQALSLPAFLADFLQGIVDRTQVHINGVTFQLGLDVPLEPNATSTDLVTFQLALDRIDVEGVTAEVRDGEGEPLIQPKEGKRHIALSQIRACLISEANVFSMFARSPSVSSPAMSRVASFAEPEYPSQTPQTPLQQRLHESDLLDSIDLSDADDALLRDSEDALQIPYELSEGSNHEEEEVNTTPRASIYQESHEPPRLPRVGRASFHDADDSEKDHIAPWAVSSDSQACSHTSLGLPAEFHLTQSAEQNLQGLSISQDARSPEHSTSLQDSNLLQGSASLGSSQASLPRSDSPDEREAAELAESRLFSHEDAESMYLSAFSHADPEQSRSTSMPGAWGDSPESSPSKPSIRASPDVSLASDPSPEPLPSPPRMEESPTDEPLQESQGELDRSVLGTSEPAAHPSAETASPTTPPRTNTPPPVKPVGPSQEDVPTPRGPTRLVKEIIALDMISVYVPSLHKHLQVQPGPQASTADFTGVSPRLARSVAPQIPGAFSMYATTHGLDASTAPQSPPPSTDHSHDDKTLEVMLSPIEVRFDASLAFLLATVCGKLLEAVKDVAEPASKPVSREPQQQQPSSSGSSAIKVMFEKISILFLSQLGGVADTAERAMRPTNLRLQPEVLLRSVFDNLTISLNASTDSLETLIDLEKFKFGYAKDDIISFDQSLQMRASVMDKLPSAGADVSVRIIKSAQAIRSEITTLPLLVQLDLQRLDETFSWFGGLSGFLSMSSSVTSSASGPAKYQAPSPRKPRGVRFNTPINPDDKSAASENKVDMRVGGFNLELRGKECIVGLETSAVKMVSRESGIGFAISKARLAGPYLRNSHAGPPITADLSGLRFDYQNTPTDADLERLLELITPSKIKFDKADDEIMVDTLLRQRRKGPILRVTVDQFQVKVSQMAQLACLPGLGEELARLGTVAKYLPEDDRPGLLLLAKVLDARASLDFGGKIGMVNGQLGDLEVAQITIPSLIAFGVGSIAVNRNQLEDLVSSPDETKLGKSPGPVLMARMIGDEMEPALKVKMRDVTIDYRVPTIMDILGLGPDATPQDFEASLAASVADLGDRTHTALASTKPVKAQQGDLSKGNTKPLKVDVLFKNCMLGLNPLKHSSKLIIALNDAQLEVVLPKDVDMQATLHINKADILLTDDASNTTEKDTSNSRRQRPAASAQISDLLSKGFVSICYISAARAVLKLTANPEDGEKRVEIEVRDELLVLETCADSTQTLIALANGLSPPTPPSKALKYRTMVRPMQDMLASIAPEAFGRAEGVYDFDEDFPMAQATAGSDDDEYDIMFDSQLIQDEAEGRQTHQDEVAGTLFSASGSIMSGTSGDAETKPDFSDHFGTGSAASSGEGLDANPAGEYFIMTEGPDSKFRLWNSVKNTYEDPPEDLLRRCPVHITVREVHVIWNLFDGFDWVRTRDEITKTVEEVEQKALERRMRRDPTAFREDEDDDVDVIGDYLFNSIYIGIPANRDPRELARMINEDINDNATFTETESIATTATVTSNRPGGSSRPKKNKLRLNRSRHHKITFELSGVNADLVVFPPGSGETQNSIDVRVYNLQIFDHIPTSTWKMFATYDKDCGERPVGTNMVHLEVLNVKPHEDLAASEMVIKATVLPLRLHVDQDALDFITRFFEFKDDKVPVHASSADVPFIQRVEVMDIPVQLDFKPKRVDYAGLKSGRTTEFMNFIILEQAHLTLRHAIVFGISGFDRMGQTLNDIWMPDVKSTQLPGVLAGLAPVRGLVNIGSGVKNLVEIPIKEYKKDGRLIRSITVGATTFARTTGTDLIKLGAKVAVGTQAALQGAENLLSTQPADAEPTSWDGDDPSDADEQHKQISLYADQPNNVVQGLRGGYAGLARDINVVRGAIFAVPGEIMESRNAQGVAQVLMRRAPTIIFRPMIGATKAIGKTLMGATNSLDPENRRRIEEKYKRH